MKATLLTRRRVVYTETAFAEFVVWEIAQPLAGSRHRFKYRLAFVANGKCVLRYDNEAGKGDHRHRQDAEARYAFVSLEKLFADFQRDIRRYLHENRDA